MIHNTTIAAISTALSEAGISVIRISGDDAIRTAEQVFVSISGKKLVEMNGYSCTLGAVYADNQKIDECIATVFRAPHSYTGEDVVELSCHGGVAVTRDILRAVLRAGAVAAQPGEFTKRAFLNGKMDLIEAESVMELISAQSSGEARAALSVKDGYISQQIGRIKADLLDLDANLAAWADYPEEDIPEVSPEHIGSMLSGAASRLHQLLKKYDNGKFLGEGISTVIIGKPNVGKSTLMNLLSGDERSIVTDIPGTTRDTVEQMIRLGDYKLRLIDTAGIRTAENEVERIGIERAKKALEGASLVICVFDSSQPLDSEDEKILDLLDGSVPAIAIVNKGDKHTERFDSTRLTGFSWSSGNISLKNGNPQELVDQLTDVVGSIFLGKDYCYEDDVIVYNERQRELIRQAYDAVSQINSADTLDAVTVGIEDVIGFLAELTGESVTDEVVDRVFHNFCVGK